MPSRKIVTTSSLRPISLTFSPYPADLAEHIVKLNGGFNHGGSIGFTMNDNEWGFGIIHSFYDGQLGIVELFARERRFFEKSSS